MIETRFTRLFDVSAPIQLAGMPGMTTPALVAAVSEAGGLGMLGASVGASIERVVQSIEDIAECTSKPFGVNFLPFTSDPERIAAVAPRVRLVEFFYQDPNPELVEIAHGGGALVGWQVGSTEEAIAAERVGCDLIVAQGTEAGGHVRGRTSLMPLLSEVLDNVSVPVVAAGGIATARDLAAVLAAGASAARIGTRFLATPESAAHPFYVEALLAASAGDTCLTEAFHVMWPDAPHRVLRSAIQAAEAIDRDIVGEFADDDGVVPVPRWSPMPPARGTTGELAAMCLYAGESVGSVREVTPAAEIVNELVSGAARLLDRVGS